MIARRFVRLALVLVVASTAPSAFADEPSAEALKARGNQAMMDLNYADALVAYRAALAKNPGDVALYYNIGRAQQARADYPEALDALLEFDRRAPPETKAKVPSLAQLIADVRAHVGELLVHCSVDVPKASIMVDGVAKSDHCTKSPERIRLSIATKSATAVVRIDSDQFQTPAVSATFQGGGPPVDVMLEVVTKATTGLLRVRATPASAVISVDGTVKGNPPIEISLNTGAHELDVEAEAYERTHIPFVITAGGSKDLSITLEKTPPITKRWWFWTGVGVLAAGALTVGGIILFQPEKPESKGSIDPRVVRAPLSTF